MEIDREGFVEKYKQEHYYDSSNGYSCPKHPTEQPQEDTACSCGADEYNATFIANLDALLARFNECEESNYGGQALVDQLRVEKQVAEQERDDARKLNDQSVCAYCGYIGTRDADCITEHILACEKHPLKTVVQLEAQLAAAQVRVWELEGMENTEHNLRCKYDAMVTALRTALERIISLEMREFLDAVEYMHMIDKLAHAALSTASKQEEE